MTKRDDKRPEGVQPLKQSPFAALANRMPPAAPAPPTSAPQPPAPQASAAPKPADAKAAPKGPARAVVRIERKGRRGKDVTIIEKLDLSPAALEAWLKELKQSLGTGGALEDTDLVLQGDHRDRAARWLEARGVKKVTVAQGG